MDSIRLRAFAKVNYALEVRGLREDGYHEISTVLQSISLADEVEIESAEKGFELQVEPGDANTGPPDTGPPEKNTVFKAWNLLRELTGEELPVRVRLCKKIPSGAGLGGASADAAAVLTGLNELFKLGLSTRDLSRAGVQVGADVPFCISGGTALGEGVGEALSPLPGPPDHRLALCKPFRGAATAEVYRAYDELSEGPGRPGYCVEPVVAALKTRDLEGLARSLENALAAVTRRLVPEIAAYEKDLLRAGALGASMTGSGTAVYGIFPKDVPADLDHRAPFAGVYEPVRCGVEIQE